MVTLPESPWTADVRDSSRDAVVRDIVRGLYDGRYEPGQRLIESELTLSYRVSRGTIREALNRLAVSGIVELIPQRGAQVRILTLDEAIDILHVVEGLVRVAARLAAARIERPGARAIMSAAIESLLAFDVSSMNPDYMAARGGFYAALTRIADNAELTRTLPSVQIHLIRVQFRSAIRRADSRRHTDYRRIAEAVLAGDGARAETEARAHLRASIRALSDYRDASFGAAAG